MQRFLFLIFLLKSINLSPLSINLNNLSKMSITFVIEFYFEIPIKKDFE